MYPDCPAWIEVINLSHNVPTPYTAVSGSSTDLKMSLFGGKELLSLLSLVIGYSLHARRSLGEGWLDIGYSVSCVYCLIPIPYSSARFFACSIRSNNVATFGLGDAVIAAISASE